MLRKSLVSTLLLTIYLGSCLLIYNSEKNNKVINTANIERNTNTSYISTVSKEENDEIIGTLIIEKLNLSKNIYTINSSHNNVEENVTILNDDINLIVLAAHSGPGYIVTNIEEQTKDGTIEINKTDSQRLILTTCSKKDKNKQLVITSKKIDA